MNKEYEIFKVDEQFVPKLNKNIKKLTLQPKGDQYTYRNVTVWPEEGLYNTVKAGETVTAFLEVTDSKTPNPHGGFYKNRTLRDPKNDNGTTMNTGPTLEPRLVALENWARTQGFGEGQDDGYPSEDINPNDIPF